MVQHGEMKPADYAVGNHNHDITYLGINATAADSAKWNNKAMPADTNGYLKNVNGALSWDAVAGTATPIPNTFVVYYNSVGLVYEAYRRSDGSIAYSGADFATVLNSAIAWTSANGGGIVHIVAGTYPCSKTVEMKNNVVLEGETSSYSDTGLSGTILSGTMTDHTPILAYTDFNSSVQHTLVRSIDITASNRTSAWTVENQAMGIIYCLNHGFYHNLSITLSKDAGATFPTVTSGSALSTSATYYVRYIDEDRFKLSRSDNRVASRGPTDDTSYIAYSNDGAGNKLFYVTGKNCKTGHGIYPIAPCYWASDYELSPSTFMVDGSTTVTCTGHGWQTPTPVRVNSKSTLPAGLAADTTYFARSLGIDTLSLHPTKADANANTNPITCDVASGTHYIYQQVDCTPAVAGAATYRYYVMAYINGTGWKRVGQPIKITNGHASPSAVNYNRLTFNKVPNAEAYRIYRSTDGKTGTGSTGLLGHIGKEFTFSNGRRYVEFNASTDTITVKGGCMTQWQGWPKYHGYSDGDRVVFFSPMGTLPLALSTSATYYVVNSTTTTFKVSLTPGGAPIDITDAGAGRIFCLKQKLQSFAHGWTDGQALMISKQSVRPMPDLWDGSKTMPTGIPGLYVSNPDYRYYIRSGYTYYARDVTTDDFALSLEAAERQCTIDTTTDIVTLNGHGFASDQRTPITFTGTLPAELAINTVYYAEYISANTFYLHISPYDTKIQFAHNGSFTPNVRSLVLFTRWEEGPYSATPVADTYTFDDIGRTCEWYRGNEYDTVYGEGLTPTVTPTLGASTTYSYILKKSIGDGCPSYFTYRNLGCVAYTENGPETLDDTHYNTLTWSDGQTYAVYRVSGATAGLISTGATTGFKDTGMGTIWGGIYTNAHAQHFEKVNVYRCALDGVHIPATGEIRYELNSYTDVSTTYNGRCGIFMGYAMTGVWDGCQNDLNWYHGLFVKGGQYFSFYSKYQFSQNGNYGEGWKDHYGYIPYYADNPAPTGYAVWSQTGSFNLRNVYAEQSNITNWTADMERKVGPGFRITGLPGGKFQEHGNIPEGSGSYGDYSPGIICDNDLQTSSWPNINGDSGTATLRTLYLSKEHPLENGLTIYGKRSADGSSFGLPSTYIVGRWGGYYNGMRNGYSFYDTVNFSGGVRTFQNSATPDVQLTSAGAPYTMGGNIYKTNGATVSITDIIGNQPGMLLIIYAGDSNTTIVHNTNYIRLNGSTNWATMPTGATLTLMDIGGVWYEIGRMTP